MPLAPPLCVACRAPAGRQFLCPDCRRALERLPPSPVPLGGLEVWAPLLYEGPARAVVRRLKFHDAWRLADHMAALIVASAPAGFLTGPLVPVPGRGHAERITSAVAKRTQLPCLPVLRGLGGRRQVGRGRAERLRTPPRFEAAHRGAGEVVLVDDVITTGATVQACASALGEAGWSCNGALAYARTPVR